jgi:pimeloyl-ACP methyl ester carboxylesterase
MPFITANDGAQIFYKDWGKGQPVLFSHGWPLTADAWDGQMQFIGSQGYRVIAHDRRSHGRSDQTWDGNHMDQYADDLAALVDALDLKDMVIVGHSTGGGEVTHYLGRHGTGRVAKVVLLGAVPPLMLKTAANPEGTPIEAFDGIRKGVFDDRSQFYKDPHPALLRLQPAGGEDLRRRARELLAPGHDGRDQGPVRLHPRVLRGRLHRGSQEDRQADPRRPRRGRSDRPHRRRRPEVGQDHPERPSSRSIRAPRTAWPPPTRTSSTPTSWPSSGPEFGRASKIHGAIPVSAAGRRPGPMNPRPSRIARSRLQIRTSAAMGPGLPLRSSRDDTQPKDAL